ncbi:MAG TPA: hypothetical protein VIB62_10200 [Actinomycetota bacterium]
MRRPILAAATALVALSACSSDTSTTPTAPATSQPPSSEPTSTATPTATETASGGGRTEVESEDSAFGLILTDSEGVTLYAFLPDDQGPSTCYDECAANWPAFEAVGELEVSGNDDDPTDAALLGTTERDDGTLQVTYNEWPLYRFGGDQAPGDTNGQGIGEIWYVMAPDGTPRTGG